MRDTVTLADWYVNENFLKLSVRDLSICLLMRLKIQVIHR